MDYLNKYAKTIREVLSNNGYVFSVKDYFMKDIRDYRIFNAKTGQDEVIFTGFNLQTLNTTAIVMSNYYSYVLENGNKTFFSEKVKNAVAHNDFDYLKEYNKFHQAHKNYKEIPKEITVEVVK